MALCLANGGASTNLGLKVLRVQEKGAELTLGVGQAGRLGPTGLGPSQPGSVAPSLPWVLMCLCTLCPLHLHYIDDVILARVENGRNFFRFPAPFSTFYHPVSVFSKNAESGRNPGWRLSEYGRK
jgi:hypothetical protein